MEEEGDCGGVLRSRTLLTGCLLGYRTLSMARKSFPTRLAAAGIRGGSCPGASAGAGSGVGEESGGVRNFLRQKLGDEDYEEVRVSTVVLEKIHYCQRALTALPACLNPVLLHPSGRASGKHSDPVLRASQRAFISHDFLVLEVRLGSGQVLHIKAEKVLYPSVTKVANIVIDLYEDFKVKASCVVLFTVECRSKGMKMDDVLLILESGTLKYDYTSENCWDYAVRTAKRLIQACRALPGLSAEEAERLRKEEKYLKGRIAGHHCHNILHAIKRLVHA